jgi:AcrR family transcriptional regulator
MEKVKNSSAWIEQGYNLFAKEGLGGIQVERLARMLGLNKSGFYHYFGDLEVYCGELLKFHIIKTNQFLNDVAKIETIDPEYLHLLIKHQLAIMFQMQLLRSNHNESFYRVARTIEEKEDALLGEVWSAYLGIPTETEVAVRYFNIVRDMFYARMSLQNMNYTFLLKLMNTAKVVVEQANRISRT